jgi:hypothetical protein
MAQARLTHARPEFGIDRVMIGSREVAIREEIALRRPFCTLLHFAKDIAASQPRVLIVAPVLGHLVLALPAKALPPPLQPACLQRNSSCSASKPGLVHPSSGGRHGRCVLGRTGKLTSKQRAQR